MACDGETGGEFLGRLGDVLKAREGGDSDLAEILAEHILTPTPADDCVAQAMTAIVSLAGARARLSEEDPDG